MGVIYLQTRRHLYKGGRIAATYTVLRRFVPVVGVVILALTVFLGTVYADDASDADQAPNEPVDTIVVSLTVDCSLTPDTPEIRRELADRNLCEYGNGTVDGDEEVEPYGTVFGNCGSLTLNLFNSGGGFLHWQTIITSSQGPMFSASYSGNAHNLHTGGGHYVSGSDSWIFSSYWQDDQAVYTGPGVIWGIITSARSTLVWGGVCTAAGTPTDVVWVT